MDMDPIKTIGPKSMKDRFCFDPHKIPTGSNSQNYVREVLHYNNASNFNQGTLVFSNNLIKVLRNLVQFSLLKSLGEIDNRYGIEINLRAEVLQHQCGMVYKATDASLLSSGLQPFVVEVIISRFDI